MVCLCLALLAAFTTHAIAERDVEFVAELRRRGFGRLAEKEINRLLARADIDEDTRVALLLEKARVAEDQAVAAGHDETLQIRLITRAQDSLRAFIKGYPRRPERVDADFELQFLNRVLGQLYARQARFEVDRARRAELTRMARLALGETVAGYKRLRGDYARRRDQLKAEAEKQQRLYEAERAKPGPHGSILRDIEEKLDELAERVNSAENYVIRCDYLAANSTGRLGKALKQIEGHEREGDSLLDKAFALYDKLFDTYKKTPYMEVAYTALCESVRVLCLAGKTEQAHKRIQAEIIYYLTTCREQIEEEELSKRVLARMRCVSAEALNALGRYEEARAQARLAMRGPAGRSFSDAAKIEIAKSFMGQGDAANAADALSEIASKAGPFRRDAIDLLSEWIKQNPGISSKFPPSVQFNLAVTLFGRRRYEETSRVLSALVSKTTGSDEVEWDPKSLLYIARCRYRQALAEKTTLEGEGRITEGKIAYLEGLKEAVSIIMDGMVAKFGGSKNPDVTAVVRRSLYYALDWQNRIRRFDSGKAEEVRLENILAAFNDFFPGAPSIPDAHYLRGARLEIEGKYADAVREYEAVSPKRNQAVVAGLRAALCRYRLYRANHSPSVDEFIALWKELNENIALVEQILSDDSSRLEEFERAQFGDSLSDGEYVRALLLFNSTDEETRAVLGENGNRHESVKKLLGGYAGRHPSSAHLSRVVFMLAWSRIALGEADAAEADVERLKENPELYRNSLAALRDGYYNLYLKAGKSGDRDAARKFADKFIGLASRFAADFPEALTSGDMMRMGNCLYSSGRYDEAEKMLSPAWDSLEKEVKSDGYPTPESRARARAALRSIGEKLGEILIACGSPDRRRKTLQIYDRLLDLRREALQADHDDERALEAALKKDPVALHYRTRRAMAVISLQGPADGELPALDALMKAVETLARTARMRERFSREWWLTEYWLACGLFLQRDFESATRVIRNISVLTDGFSDEKGAGDIALQEKTFRKLFDELSRKIEIEQH